MPPLPPPVPTATAAPPTREPTPTLSPPTLPPPTRTPHPTPEPGPIRKPITAAIRANEQTLLTTEVAVRDLRSLVVRFQGVSPEVPVVVNEEPPQYPLGTVREFWVRNADTHEHFRIPAQLRYKTEHVYMWVEVGQQVTQEQLKEAADFFEAQIYPTNRAFFGSEWTPGVDNDPRITILHASGLGDSVAGYYSSADEFAREVYEFSNEMEMLYVNLDPYMSVGSSLYKSVLAHEFQHMIHWYHDRNEETWLKEGFSVLASRLNGLDPGGFDEVYLKWPDTQLTSWAESPGRATAHYGAAYLFASYFLERFGEEATRAVVAHPLNGTRSIDAVLADLGAELTFEEVFADWVVANYLDREEVRDKEYQYRELALSRPRATANFNAYPVEAEMEVQQFGADYVVLRGGADLRVKFTGATQVRLVNALPHSGRYFWWSNRGDDSDMTLTRAFDLSDVDSATLQFWTWYDLERDWDYAYIEVSTDGGTTWQILTTPSGTGEDPTGNNLGWGYTGRSGGSQADWVYEEVDLTPYVGGEVLIRFEHVTDEAVNRPGFLVDDVAIPEIGYAYDAETDDGWEGSGFVRTNNLVPQRHLALLILFGDEIAVERLAFNDDQTAEWTVPLAGEGLSKAVLVLSGLAPVTTQPACYRLDITEQ